jgi:isocitrate lyase
MLRTAIRAVSRPRRLPAITLRPLSATAPWRMTADKILQTSTSPLNTILPCDSFQLLPESSKAGAAEDALFDAQVKQLEDWWKSPRFAGIKRPYSAEDVVKRRGTLQQVYPSSVMARKLFELFEKRAAEGQPVHTSTHHTHNSLLSDQVLMRYSGCY